MKITRRRLARRSLAGLMAAPAAFPALAQAPAPGDAAKNAAQAEYHSAARELGAVKLPRAVEPASRFEA